MINYINWHNAYIKAGTSGIQVGLLAGVVSTAIMGNGQIYGVGAFLISFLVTTFIQSLGINFVTSDIVQKELIQESNYTGAELVNFLNDYNQVPAIIKLINHQYNKEKALTIYDLKWNEVPMAVLNINKEDLPSYYKCTQTDMLQISVPSPLVPETIATAEDHL